MPRSRSRSLESMTRSTSSWLARKTPLWRSMASTSVVLPWSTWAMMAMLRIPLFKHSSAIFLRGDGRRPQTGDGQAGPVTWLSQ